MKAKSFYKNNKHNNMNPKEKENNQEEELKTQATPNVCDEETVGQETFEGNQRADHRADACPGIGTRQDVQARLPERDCREKDDLSERQAADHRNDGTTNQRAQYQPEH